MTTDHLHYQDQVGYSTKAVVGAWARGKHAVARVDVRPAR